eukprot:1497216-Alexandrium_andersonii.AAC.1
MRKREVRRQEPPRPPSELQPNPGLHAGRAGAARGAAFPPSSDKALGAPRLGRVATDFRAPRRGACN